MRRARPQHRQADQQPTYEDHLLTSSVEVRPGLAPPAPKPPLQHRPERSHAYRTTHAIREAAIPSGHQGSETPRVDLHNVEELTWPSGSRQCDALYARLRQAQSPESNGLLLATSSVVCRRIGCRHEIAAMVAVVVLLACLCRYGKRQGGCDRKRRHDRACIFSAIQGAPRRH